ncbi:MAG: hypothetical protein M1825_003186 [Sarcosagium campestre]|nr:MAG: hypothetical protein M1825_003186 [Sarcosagium campestre]
MVMNILKSRHVIVIDDSSSDAEESLRIRSKPQKRRKLNVAATSASIAQGADNPVHVNDVAVEIQSVDSPLIANSINGLADSQPEAPQFAAKSEETIWQQKILDLFPDICRDHLDQLAENLGAEPSRRAIEALAIDLLDAESYPKEKDRLERLELEQQEARNKFEQSRTEIALGATFDLAAEMIRDDFPRVPINFIMRTLTSQRQLYKAYLEIDSAEVEYDASEAKRYVKLKKPRKPKGLTEAAKSMQSDSPHGIALQIELEEARAVRVLNAEKRQILLDQEKAEAENEAEHRRTGDMLECQCCFDDVAINRTAHCNGDTPHFFCFDCARRNAENELGQSKYRLNCMDGSGCDAIFSDDQLPRFLEAPAIETLSRLQQQDELRLAGLEGLVECPFCDYAAILPPVEVDREFRCANSRCNIVSCRLCQRPSHIPMSCAEAAKESHGKARHAVEEAMSMALIRTCPKCKTPYLKQDGCNKMTCPKCKTMQCYVCSKVITDYRHFNDKRMGGNTEGCPLYEDTNVRHAQEVAKAEKLASEKAKAENPDISDEMLKITKPDVEAAEAQARIDAIVNAQRHGALHRPNQMPVGRQGIGRNQNQQHMALNPQQLQGLRQMQEVQRQRLQQQQQLMQQHLVQVHQQRMQHLQQQQRQQPQIHLQQPQGQLQAVVDPANLQVQVNRIPSEHNVRGPLGHPSLPAASQGQVMPRVGWFPPQVDLAQHSREEEQRRQERNAQFQLVHQALADRDRRAFEQSAAATPRVPVPALPDGVSTGQARTGPQLGANDPAAWATTTNMARDAFMGFVGNVQPHRITGERVWFGNPAPSNDADTQHQAGGSNGRVLQ